MHAGKSALIRVCSGLLLMTLACSAAAQKDAAEKVQEGNVNNWIEYYKKQRESTHEATRSAEEGEKTRAHLKHSRKEERADEALPRDAQDGSQK